MTTHTTAPRGSRARQTAITPNGVAGAGYPADDQSHGGTTTR